MMQCIQSTVTKQYSYRCKPLFFEN